MMRIRNLLSGIPAILIVSAFLGAVGTSAGEQARPTDIRIVGTGDGLEIVSAIGAIFTADHPDFVAIVPTSIGSGGGIAAIGSGAETLARIARPLTQHEKDSGLREVPIFRLSSAFYVHPSAGITNITSDALAAVYRGELTNWRQLGGNDVRIKVVRREEKDSTLLVLRVNMPHWRDLPITSRSKMAMTTQEAVETAERVEGAIGFGPYTRFLEPALQVLAVDDIHPTSPEYPSYATVSLAYNEATVGPVEQAIIAFARSEKARAVIERFGGIPVASD
ncbi:MAG TPA: substrate-binding domain-containing protein [Afifellaceae bacterium]|nr:substrate-binding domain-containing protein [Afifellaceae bacterium]